MIKINQGLPTYLNHQKMVNRDENLEHEVWKGWMGWLWCWKVWRGRQWLEGDCVVIGTNPLLSLLWVDQYLQKNEKVVWIFQEKKDEWDYLSAWMEFERGSESLFFNKIQEKIRTIKKAIEKGQCIIIKGQEVLDQEWSKYPNVMVLQKESQDKRSSDIGKAHQKWIRFMFNEFNPLDINRQSPAIWPARQQHKKTVIFMKERVWTSDPFFELNEEKVCGTAKFKINKFKEFQETCRQEVEKLL